MKESCFYRIVRPIITFLFKICYRPKIEGRENIPKEGRVILAGNHTSNLDCLLLISSTSRTIHFLAKDSLIKGIKGPIFKGMGIIPVNRRQKDSKSLHKAIEVLNHNQVIGIFPEGTINRTGDITMPFKFGAVKMSFEANSIIIPFAIMGKYQLFRSGIHIQFLEPYRVSSSLEAENEKLREKVSQMLVGKKENA